ncbi:MAG: helix-turn-helix transcriptional regulator [Chitinophagaceae bacterium]|nr:helix-turn-helix transcriptional regulator [Chitinophagaceae bacterium]
MNPDERVRMAFAQQFKQIRKLRGFTQVALAQRLKINKAEISRIENARRSPRFSRLVALANALEVALIVFFSDEHFIPPAQTTLSKNNGLRPLPDRPSSTQGFHKKFIPLKITEEKQRFGRRLQKIRKQRKQVQVDIEVLSHVPSSDISRFENGLGNIELNTIAILADALQVPVSALFDYEGPLPDINGDRRI